MKKREKTGEIKQGFSRPSGVSLVKYKEIFSKHGYNYTDDQLKGIQQLLRLMARIWVDSFEKKRAEEK